MPYIDPRLVISPKASIRNLRVLHDGGEFAKGNPWSGWALAEFEWDGSPAVGARWNGDERGVGNPQSRGVATWFVLPDPLAEAARKSLEDAPNGRPVPRKS